MKAAIRGKIWVYECRSLKLFTLFNAAYIGMTTASDADGRVWFSELKSSWEITAANFKMSGHLGS